MNHSTRLAPIWGDCSRPQLVDKENFTPKRRVPPRATSGEWVADGRGPGSGRAGRTGRNRAMNHSGKRGCLADDGCEGFSGQFEPLDWVRFMMAVITPRGGPRRSPRERRLLLAAVVIGTWQAALAHAQTADQPASGDPMPRPVVPRSTPRPLEGPGSVSTFLKGLGNTDAQFEVPLGQGRVLTTQDDITKGRGAPLIAVGDPTVIDFIVLSPRQIRVIGKRIGTTDLVVAAEIPSQSYTFEVRVVADLDPLRTQLRSSLPAPDLRLSQLRDQIIVEGEARDAPRSPGSCRRS